MKTASSPNVVIRGATAALVKTSIFLFLSRNIIIGESTSWSGSTWSMKN